MKWGIKCVIKDRNKRPGYDWELTHRGWEKWCSNGGYEAEVHNDINEAYRILIKGWYSYAGTSYYVEELRT